MMKLIYEEKKIVGYDVIECYGEQAKTVCFINHGFLSNKEEGTYFMMFELAKLGLHVVAIDAYKHGSRLEEPMISGSFEEKEASVLEMALQTAKDIKSIYDQYYSNEYSDCMVTGISMGGLVTYLAAYMIPQAQWIVPIIGFPSLKEIAEDAGDKINSEKDAWLKQYDPMSHLDDLAGKHILICNSEDDQVVKVKYARKYYQALVEKDICQIEMHEFEVGHNVPMEMRQVVYEKIKEYLIEID